MTNPSHESEEPKPPKPIRIVLPREVCTTPEATAKLMHRAILDAVAELRRGDFPVDRADPAAGP